MGDSLQRYPRGQIGHGSGALIEVENVDLDVKTNSKLKHTLARTPSGYTTGTREATLSFKMNIGENGPERDFYTALDNGSVQGFRLLLPGALTFRVTGVVNSNKYGVPLDDAVTVDIEVICKVQKA
jgi:hypothetical protein